MSLWFMTFSFGCAVVAGAVLSPAANAPGLPVRLAESSRRCRLFVDPGIRQCGPDRGLASVLGQAKAVRAVGEHVHGVGNTAGRQRRGEAVGVFGRDVGVLCGVPDEERRDWDVTSESSDVDRRSCGLASSPRRISRAGR